ncbi:MAG: hypothetical protein AB7N65_14995 [Vicinamibacterales bacterium]
MRRLSLFLSRLPILGLVAIALLGVGCQQSETPTPAVATPSVTLNHDRAPAGSPVEITYKFVVADGAAFDKDYRVMVHIVDTDEELMWTDDHDPPVPTSQWKPGQTVEYTRTVFVPVYPYVGNAGIYLGLYSTAGDDRRLSLNGQDMGQHAYRVGTLNLLPQTENLFTVFKEGWHPAEVSEQNGGVEWQWTKKEAVLAFKNPKKDAVLYLDLDSPGKDLHGTQQVQVSLGGQPLETFALEPEQQVLRRIALPAGAMGDADMAELQIAVDSTFVPASIRSSSKDNRELGVRVFHAYVDAR